MLLNLDTEAELVSILHTINDGLADADVLLGIDTGRNIIIQPDDAPFQRVADGQVRLSSPDHKVIQRKAPNVRRNHLVKFRYLLIDSHGGRINFHLAIENTHLHNYYFYYPIKPALLASWPHHMQLVFH